MTMRTLRLALGTTLVAGVAALLFACGGGGGGSGGAAADVPGTPATGRVAVVLTDGPLDGFDQVNVTITSIELLSDAGKVTVFSGEQTLNLLDLKTEAELFTVASDVPAGTYDKIRLAVSHLELVKLDADGLPIETVEPKLPGNGKIDLNPRQPFMVTQDETVVVQLDLDAGKSIHLVQKGHGEEYVFRPVVFVDVVTQGLPGKLVRVRGVVSEVQQDSFVLCPIGTSPRDLSFDGGGSRCVEVDVSEASIFDENGDLADGVAVDDPVEAVGRFRLPTADGEATQLPVFDASVVEIGTYLKLRGAVVSDPDLGDSLGTFLFALDPDQGIQGNVEVQVVLDGGTRIFAEDGTALDTAAVRVGRRGSVDGVLFLSDGEPDLLKASLVILADEPQAPEELEGTISAVGAGDRTLTLDGDAGCAVVPLAARLFTIEELPPGSATAIDIQPIDFTYLGEGQQVDLFGAWPEGGGCFQVDVGFVLLPLP